MVWWDRKPLMGGVSASHLRKIGNLDLSLGGNYFKNEGYRTGDYSHRLRGNLGLRYRFKRVDHRLGDFEAVSTSMEKVESGFAATARNGKSERQK